MPVDGPANVGMDVMSQRIWQIDAAILMTMPKQGCLCRCIITKSAYTKNEDFATADAIYDEIGEAGEEKFSLNDLTTAGVTDPKVVNA